MLRVPAEPIDDPTTPEIARLILDMLETMADAGGIGLAATQVHVPGRLVIFSVPPARADDPEAPLGSPRGPQPATVLINPEITVLDDALEEGWEGCLSVPGMIGRVPRWRRIGVRGLTPRAPCSSARPRASTPGWRSTSATTWMGFSIPCGCAIFRTFGFVEELQRGPQPAQREPERTPAGAGSRSPADKESDDQY